MTWAERFGDLITNVVLVVVNALRIITLILRIAADKIDDFVTSLAEQSEGGISPTRESPTGWLRLPASVAWGVAAIVLRSAPVVTVFVRQATATIDEFLRTLVEGDGPPPVAEPSGDQPPPASTTVG